jgi:starch synthase
MIRVLAVSSEIYPLVKTGGLADVVGALPAAVRNHGIEIKTLVPGYPAVMAAMTERETLLGFENLFGGAASLFSGKVGGLDLIALDAPHLFDRPGNPYLGPDGKDWPDNWKRFGALCFAAGEVATGAAPSFVPAIVHAHDWTAALAPAYVRYGRGNAKSLITIHNLAFQGHFPASIFPQLHLPAEAYGIEGVEYYGGVGFLKSGLQYADAITTVSPTYAEEICTPAGGMGLDGLLRVRRSVLTGIVNGVDTEVWNPATDENLMAKYSAARLPARARNKQEIESLFGLESGDGMIVALVSRLTWQKGIDLLGECLDGLVADGIRLAALGSGDAALEGMFRAAAARHRGRIGVVTGFDERMSHLLQGGADAIVIPSRFEPCGLTQFYGLRYGCVPVVARVGGLADTIIDANDAALSAGVATGIQFFPVDVSNLNAALRRALRLYADRKAWRGVQRRGMKSDVSWGKSAARYAELYKTLAGKTGFS